MRELAHFARCSHPTIQRIENGTLAPSAALKARLARILRVPLDELWPVAPPNDHDPEESRAVEKVGAGAARQPV